MQITLTTEERTLVESILDDALRATREEVRRTDTPNYKDSLRLDENVIRSVLNKLRTGS